MKAVKFITSRRPYMAGEVAVFPDDKADMLVKMGFAKYHKVVKKPLRKRTKQMEAEGGSDYVTK